MKILMSVMFLGLLLTAISSHGDDNYYRPYPGDVNPPSGYSADDSPYRQFRTYDRSYLTDVNPPSGYSSDDDSYHSHQPYQEDRSYPHGFNPPSGYYHYYRR